MANPKGKNHPNWGGGRKLNGKGYVLLYKPDHPRANSKNYVYEHILVAEKALGKPLPPGAVVHHCGTVDDQTQLVICQDQAYHMLLHRRLRALKACGHANWRKCKICKQYDKPENLVVRTDNRNVYHKKCKSQYDRERYQNKKEDL